MPTDVTVCYRHCALLALHALLLLTVAMPGYAQAPASSEAQPDCDSHGPLHFICGVAFAEDVVPVPATDWLIASGLGLGAGGTLKLVDTRTATASVLYPAATTVAPDTQFYADCPGPPDAGVFTAHGLALQPLSAQRYLLYAAHEGDRRSIEVFELDTGAARPALRWTGCVVMPANTNANAVAPLAGRGMAIVSMDDGAADRMAAHVRGEASGTVYEWQPATGLRQLDAIHLRGGNGIVVSADQRWWFVSAWSGAELVRIDRTRGDTSAAVTRLALGFLPDNLKWASDGSILVAGQRPPVSRIANCTGDPCLADWVLGRIDPATLAVQELVVAGGTAEMNYATGVVEHGEAYYITSRGRHRIGVIASAKLRAGEVLRLGSVSP